MREEVPHDTEWYYIQRSHDRCIAWTEVSKRFDEITGSCDRPESSLQTKWNTALRWKFSEDLKLGELVHKHAIASEGQGYRNYKKKSEVDWGKVLRDYKDDSSNPTIVKRRVLRLGLVRKKEASKSLGRPRVRPKPVAIYSDRLSATGFSDIRLKNRYSKVEYARIFEGNAYSFIFDLHSRQDSTNPCYDLLAPVFTLLKTELEPKREPIDPQDTSFLVTLHLNEWKAVKVCLENYVFTAERHRKLFKRCLINWLFPGSRPQKLCSHHFIQQHLITNARGKKFHHCIIANACIILS
mmetsp:Transcript_9591/g.15921  ORF Transcript_9591/g.15921 Transcript_9591/m.15921 type:complete len:296 (+) Transcript_9591:468-1355(+)